MCAVETGLMREMNPRVSEIIDQLLNTLVELRAMRFEAGTAFELGRAIGQEDVFKDVYSVVARVESFPDDLVLSILSPRMKSWQNGAYIAKLSANRARTAEWSGYHEGKMFAYAHAIRLAERAFALRRY